MISSRRDDAEANVVLVDGGFVYTADEDDTIIPEGSVLIVDGRIAEVGATSEVRRSFQTIIRQGKSRTSTVDARGRLVLPGFVNGHWHDMFASRMAFGAATRSPNDCADQPGFFAGGGDMHTISAMFCRSREMIDALTPAEAEAIARYSLWTQLRTGVTAVGDLGSLNRPEALAAGVLKLGMRGAISTWAADVVCRPGEAKPTRVVEVEAVLSELDEVLRLCAEDPSGRLMARPSAVYTTNMSDELGEGLAAIVASHQTRFATHLGALRNEADFVASYFGARPVERLRRLGILSSQLTAVHCSYLDDGEVSQLVGAGVHFDHSPAKYGSSGESVMSGTKLLTGQVQAGARVSVSTDGAPVLLGGMLENMRAAWQGHNEIAGDNTLVSPSRALAMGTADAARGLGWAGLGSLRVGNEGDVVLIPVDDWRYVLNPRPLESLLTAGCSADVEAVLVGGRLIVDDCSPVLADEREMEREFVDALSSFSRRLPMVDPGIVDALASRYHERAQRPLRLAT